MSGREHTPRRGRQTPVHEIEARGQAFRLEIRIEELAGEKSCVWRPQEQRSAADWTNGTPGIGLS